MKILRKILEFFRRVKRQHRERGAITMAETLIALGVGAAVLAVVFAGIPAVMAARDASNAQNGLAQLSTSIRSTFGARGDFTGLNNDLVRSLAGFPHHFRSGDRIVHPWGGGVSIAPAASNPRRFTILFEDVPSRGCISVAGNTLAIATKVRIGATVIDLDAADDVATPYQDESSASNIAGLCTASDAVDIAWTFSA